MRRAHKIFPQRSPRDTAEKRVTLLHHDGGETPIVVRNVSQGGFMAETGRFVWIGSRITVTWPDGDVRQAQVRWALPGRFGAAFQDG